MNGHQSKIEEILAKDEIREVIMRLARGTDRRDRELMRSCYHPDAVDDHGAFGGSGDEFADWVLEMLQPIKTQHFLGQIRIEVEGNVAHAGSYGVQGPADSRQNRPAVILGDSRDDARQQALIDF